MTHDISRSIHLLWPGTAQHGDRCVCRHCLLKGQASDSSSVFQSDLQVLSITQRYPVHDNIRQRKASLCSRTLNKQMSAVKWRTFPKPLFPWLRWMRSRKAVKESSWGFRKRQRHPSFTIWPAATKWCVALNVAAARNCGTAVSPLLSWRMVKWTLCYRR